MKGGKKCRCFHLVLPARAQSAADAPPLAPEADGAASEPESAPPTHMLSIRDVKMWPETVPFTRNKSSFSNDEHRELIEWYANKLRLDIRDTTIISRIQITPVVGGRPADFQVSRCAHSSRTSVVVAIMWSSLERAHVLPRVPTMPFHACRNSRMASSSATVALVASCSGTWCDALLDSGCFFFGGCSLQLLPLTCFIPYRQLDAGFPRS